MPQYNLGTARGRVDINTSGLKEADISLREAGRGLLYTGGALVAGFGYVVKTAADFEKQMDFVQAITQGTAAEMDELKEVAIELGKRGPYGPQEVTESFVELAKAGIETKDIIDGVGEASVNLAAAADIGLVESTEILVNTLKTFDLQAKDSTKVVDLIAGAANASTIDVDDFAYSLRYAGSVAAAVNIPLEDVASALAILGDRGIKGSTGGTSLRRILLNLQPASKKAEEALTSLGIITEDGTNKFFTAEGSAKSLADVFQILNDATADLTDAERLKAFNTIFGARAAPSALILSDQAAAGFNDYMDAIDRTTAADVAAARLDNLAGSVTKLKAALEAVFIQSGTPFQESLKELVDIVRELVLWFGELPEPVQKFLVGGVAVVGVLSLMAGAFLLTVGNIVRAIRVMGQLGALFGLIGGGGKAGGAAGAAQSVGLLSRAFGFLLSPVGLVILAIAALVGAFIYFYKTNEKFREFINSIPGKIVDAWNAVVAFFKGPVVEAFKTAYNAVKGFFGDIGGFFGGIGSSIGGFFGDLFGSIGDIGGSAFNGITGFFETLGNIDIGGGIEKALILITDFAEKVPGALLGAGEAALEGFMSFMSKLPSRLGYALGFALGRLIKWNIDFYTKIVELSQDVLNKVIEWGGQMISAIASWTAEILVKVGIWVLDMVNKAIELGTEFLIQITIFFSQLPGMVAGWMLDILTSIVTAIPGIAAAAADLGWQVLTKITEFVSQLPGKVLGWMADIGTSIFNKIPEITGFAIDLGEGVFNGVIDAITGLPGAVLGIFTGVVGSIKDQVTSAFNAAKDFGGSLWNGFKDGMGISSPSYIERALFAVEGQAFQTAANLKKAVNLINARAPKLPTNLQSAGETAALGGINGPATAGTGAERIRDDGTTVNITIQELHLGGGATEEDAVRLSRILADETERQLEAQGQRTLVTRGRQFSTTPS